MQSAIERVDQRISQIFPAAVTGTVLETCGSTIAVAGLPVPMGAIVEIRRPTQSERLLGQVIGFRQQHTLVYPLAETTGVQPGQAVHLTRTLHTVRVGTDMIGRVVNAHGKPIDDQGPLSVWDHVPTEQKSPSACQRPQIVQKFETGIRAIDGLLTCGRGQRVGILAAAGVGKSVCLGMMAKRSAADVNVIALVGERGREVNDFIHRGLGASGLSRSIVVVATSDEPATVRVQAAKTATAIAEYFRDRGQHVLLLMDSVTRFARAQREIGLAAGEPTTVQGYTPSVLDQLPRLFERAGPSKHGSITAAYSLLVEGDHQTDYLCNNVRGLLDGHIVLSRELASKGHFPAIDILASVSRLMPSVAHKNQLEVATRVRNLLSAYRDHEDLISIGAYQSGANALVDLAIDKRTMIDQFLQQDIDENCPLRETQEKLFHLGAQLTVDSPE